MKIAVVGAGAMGSIYAALMGDAGHEVWAVDQWREHIDAINVKGLRVEGASGDRTVKINATTDAGEVGSADLVIIATKASAVAAAAEAARPLLHDDTVVLGIQNGLGSAEAIRAAVDRDAVLVGVAGGFGASVRAPGHAHHNGMELIRLGEAAGGGITERLEKVVALWESAGFRAKAFGDIDQLIWEKFICNVCFSGSCTVTGLTVGGVLNDSEAWKLASICATEAFLAGRARGIAFGFDEPVRYVREFGEKIPGSQPSMLQDHLARRHSEIDAINGAVPRVAAKVGTTAPFNEAVTAIVRAREAAFDAGR